MLDIDRNELSDLCVHIENRIEAVNLSLMCGGHSIDLFRVKVYWTAFWNIYVLNIGAYGLCTSSYYPRVVS